MGAVQALREQGCKYPITMISSEPNLPIDRTKLSKALIPDASKLELRSQEWFDSAAIKTIHDEVTKIDFDGKTVFTKSNQTYPYTNLVLATGGTPKALPLPGFKELSNIFLLRQIPHVQAILSAVGDDKGKNIVIIGSSFIGMEVANALSANNSVTVVGMEGTPLERVMGAQIGQILQSKLEKSGVKFRMSASVDSAQPSESDPSVVGSVRLKDGPSSPPTSSSSASASPPLPRTCAATPPLHSKKTAPSAPTSPSASPASTASTPSVTSPPTLTTVPAAVAPPRASSTGTWRRTPAAASAATWPSPGPTARTLSPNPSSPSSGPRSAASCATAATPRTAGTT